MFSLSCSFESSFFMDFAEAMAANILPCLLSTVGSVLKHDWSGCSQGMTSDFG